jgi:hypothetical protein
LRQLIEIMNVMLPPVRARQLHGAERIQSTAESTAFLEELKPTSFSSAGTRISGWPKRDARHVKICATL